MLMTETGSLCPHCLSLKQVSVTKPHYNAHYVTWNELVQFSLLTLKSLAKLCIKSVNIIFIKDY